MKHSIYLLTILLIISFRTIAQKYGLNNADPALFSKYKIPETNLSTFNINTQLDFNSVKDDYLINYPGNEYSSNSFNYNFSSSFSPKYYLLKEKDDRVFSLDIQAFGSYINQYSKSHNSYNDGDDFEKARNLQVFINLDFNYKKYVELSEIFYSVGSKLKLEIDDRKYDGTSYNNSTVYSGTKIQEYKIFVGIGWGKIRNVSPIVSAIRFQERLKQLNIINQDLNEKAIENLAEQLSKKMYYANVYDRSGKYLWNDIENALMKNGVSLSGLNQYGSYYLKEISNEIRFQRNEGLSAGINFQFEYFNNYFSNNLDHIYEQYFTLGNVFLNYSHQLNLNSQINVDLSLSGGPSISKHPNYRQKYLVNCKTGYNYELTDRVVTTIANTLDLSFVNTAGQIKNLTDDLQFRINYFVEDKISLNMSYNLRFSNSKFLDGNNSKVDNIFSLGLTYYIDRGFLY